LVKEKEKVGVKENPFVLFVQRIDGWET